MTKLIIQLSVSRITRDDILLTATDYSTDEILETNITVDEAYAHNNWIIVSNYWPIDTDIPSVSFTNPRRYTDVMSDMQKEVKALCEERDMLPDNDRYRFLESKDGPIRSMQRKIDTYKMLVSVAMKAMLGVWPNDFRERLGI